MKQLTGILLVLLLGPACATQGPGVRPNVVLIVADDQGWGDLSVNGNRNISTPNIDRLARDGVTLDRFFVSPVCSPTRAELLTGRYHVRGGVYSTSTGGERLDLDEVTIGDVFKAAGYATAAYGKWHNGMQPPYHPNARGFADFYGFCSGHWGEYFSPMLEHNGSIVDGNGFITDDLTDHGLRFIEANRERPFFLYLPLNTPHAPMQVPDRWWKEYENKELVQRNRNPEREDIAFTRAALAMSANIDWNVGRLLGWLDELALSERTIVLYCSDNGPNSWRWNGGMKGRKGSTDEGGVRSPLFIKWAGRLPSGKKVEQIAGAIDLLPTLAELTGIDLRPEKPLDGTSLAPLLREEHPEWPERMLISHWNKRTSVRSQRFRLDQAGQLFDLQADPGQTNDVSAEHPDMRERMLEERRTWEASVLSELPAEDSRPFPVGHPDFAFTQLPARDAVGLGQIERSSRHPNCTFFTNWTSLDDRITWDVEVLTDGEYAVEVYYTCPAKDVGAEFELSFQDSKLKGMIREAHDPPLRGMEDDRVPRTESYVKDFRPLNLGTIHLTRGRGPLSLRATRIPGSQVMDFRLLMLTRQPAGR